MIGAGSVVTKDVPDYSLVYGNPARFRGWICVCAEKLKFNNSNYVCSCGRKFKKSADGRVEIVVEEEVRIADLRRTVGSK